MSGNNNHPPTLDRQSIEEATTEAEARALEYDPNIRARYIREMLRDIARWMAEGMSEDTIREKVPDFVESLEPGSILSFINPSSSTDSNFLWSQNVTVSAGVPPTNAVNGIVGKLQTDEFVMNVEYADPNNRLNNLSTSYVIPKNENIDESKNNESNNLKKTKKNNNTTPRKVPIVPSVE